VTRRLADDDLVHAKGDPPDGLYGIVSGNVKFSSQGANGHKTVLTVLEAGQWFGADHRHEPDGELRREACARVTFQSETGDDSFASHRCSAGPNSQCYA
jgi:CRP-like cAMP-binding protein